MAWYHSYALKRDFTQEEWGAYTTQHSPQDVVASYHGYAYNCCDVCLNPTQVAQGESGGLNFTAYVFRAPNGRWGYQYSVQAHTSGSYSGSSLAREETLYDTREEAVTMVLVKCRQRLQKYTRTSDAAQPGTTRNNANNVVALSRQIDEQLYSIQHRQLTLF
jgi:hypothetical protein